MVSVGNAGCDKARLNSQLVSAAAVACLISAALAVYVSPSTDKAEPHSSRKQRSYLTIHPKPSIGVRQS